MVASDIENYFFTTFIPKDLTKRVKVKKIESISKPWWNKYDEEFSATLLLVEFEFDNKDRALIATRGYGYKSSEYSNSLYVVKGNIDFYKGAIKNDFFFNEYEDRDGALESELSEHFYEYLDSSQEELDDIAENFESMIKAELIVEVDISHFEKEHRDSINESIDEVKNIAFNMLYFTPSRFIRDELVNIAHSILISFGVLTVHKLEEFVKETNLVELTAKVKNPSKEFLKHWHKSNRLNISNFEGKISILDELIGKYRVDLSREVLDLKESIEKILEDLL